MRSRTSFSLPSNLQGPARNYPPAALQSRLFSLSAARRGCRAPKSKSYHAPHATTIIHPLKSPPPIMVMARVSARCDAAPSHYHHHKALLQTRAGPKAARIATGS